MISLSDGSYKSFTEANCFAVIVFDAKWDIVPREMILRQIINAEQKNESSVAFAYVDVDLCPVVVSHLAILNVPTVVYYRDGKIIEKNIGASQRVLEKIGILYG